MKLSGLQLLVVILISSQQIMALELDTQSLIKGGTAITSKHSLYNSLINSPSLLSQRDFSIEVQLTNRISQDLYSLYNDRSKIENSDMSRIKNIFQEKNNTYLQGNFGISFYNFGFSKFKRGTAYAVLNNPVYPNAQTSILIDDGFVFGYSNQIKEFIFGVSVENFTRERRNSSANVLEYEAGILELIDKNKHSYLNLGFGYLLKKDLSIIFNLKNSDKFRFYSGFSKKYGHLNFALELHDIQDNNIENSIHYGIDYKFSLFKLNLGMNQNYLSYGIGIENRFFNFSFGWVKLNAYEQYRQSFENFTFNFSFGYNL